MDFRPFCTDWREDRKLFRSAELGHAAVDHRPIAVEEHLYTQAPVHPKASGDEDD
jgi:hypothetical protein